MEKHCQCGCKKLIDKLIGHIEKLDCKEQNIILDFDLDTFKKASKVLSCSIMTVRNAVDNGVLISGIHYRYNGRKKYHFCTYELLKIKGTL